MALILSLETSAVACSVALHDHGIPVANLEIKEGQAHGAKLAVLIDEVFRASATKVKALNAVAVSAGPGSYTGLRIGTSTAKGLCYALNIPLIAVNTLDLLTYAFLKQFPSTDGLFCPMIDAKRMEVYCQVATREGRIIQPVEAKVVEPHTFDELLKDRKMFFFGDGAGKCKAVISHPGASFTDGIVPEALVLGEVAFSKFEGKEFENLVNFTPFYLKDFIAKKAAPAF